MTNEEFNNGFRDRTRAFAVLIYRMLDTLPATVATRNISYQLSRSASSVGANFRAFCRGRSRNEKYAKICIVVEEADETEYWLQIIHDLSLLKPEVITNLLKEIDEIVRVTSSIKNKLRKA